MGLENYSEALLDEGRREGGQYGVPLDANSFNALYNKDLFEQLGLSVPTTLSEFDHVCRTLQETGSPRSPAALPSSGRSEDTAIFIPISRA